MVPLTGFHGHRVVSGVGHWPIFYLGNWKSRKLLKASERQIFELLEPTIVALGLELWGIEQISQGRHSVLRVYIDSKQGVAIEDCERASKQISGILDVEDPVAGEYMLEVSSPGADRRLFSIDQFSQYIGADVNIRFRVPHEGRRKLRGKIVGVEDETISVATEDVEYRFPFEAIDKANIDF